MSDVIRIDERLLLAGATAGMAWTNEQLKLIGALPPHRGWKQRIVGRRITREDAVKFLTSARKSRHRPKTEQEIARATAILNRYPSVPGKSWREQKAARKQDGDCACPICHGDGVIYPDPDRDCMAASLKPCPLCVTDVLPRATTAAGRPPWEPA